MRPIWKGHISFGLVNVPVAIYPAEQRTDLQLHMLDARNHSRVRYERVNAETGEEVPWDQVVRGYEYDKGNYVVIEKEELQQAAPEATRTVEIEAFVDIAEIDPVYFDKPYYLEPDKKGEKGYALLRDAMRETKRAGLARVVIRTRQYMGVMVPRGDALVLHLLRYPQEIRSMDGLRLPGAAADFKVTPQELKMARTLIQSMERPWDPSEHHDEFREALLNWIEKKAKAGDLERAPDTKDFAEEKATTPADLMETLQRSVVHAGASRGRREPVRKKSRTGAATRATPRKARPRSRRGA
jgi:DNA end-binding protein Ku